MSAAAPSSGRWLFGPTSDLLFGCGALYAILFAIFAVAGSQLRALTPDYTIPLAILICGVPHYGATILRVYEQRQDRRAYAIFSVWATLAVAVIFAIGVYDVRVGSWFATVYLLWSPWHYTGQNYGLSVMFLRRRGVPIDDGAKRMLYFTFILSFAVFFVTMNQATDASLSPPDASVYLGTGSAIHFISLGIPTLIAQNLFYGLSVLYVAAVMGFLFQMRGTPMRDLVPSLFLMLTQALWFSIPLTANYLQIHTGLEPIDQRFSIGFYVMLAALGHCIQYLWVTVYYARRSGDWRGSRPYFAKIMVAGAAVWGLPAVIFAPDGFGNLSYFGGLGLLVASAVNIHHFILDGAIWKLRNFRVSSVLIRSDDEGERATEAGRRGVMLRKAVWGVALVGFAAHVTAFWENYVAVPAAMERGNDSAAEAALDRLAWVGRDDPKQRRLLAQHAAKQGDYDRAVEQFRRSLALFPSAYTASELGALLERREDWPGALEAYEQALALVPQSTPLAVRAAGAALHVGDTERARQWAERADPAAMNEEDVRKRFRWVQEQLGS